MKGGPGLGPVNGGPALAPPLQKDQTVGDVGGPYTEGTS